MEHEYLFAVILVATSIVVAVPTILMQTEIGVQDVFSDHALQFDRLPLMLLEHPSNITARSGPDSTEPHQAMVGGPGFIGPPADGGEEFITFERVPPSDRERTDEGVDVYRLSGSDRVRVEIYKGQQATTGYDVHIAQVSKNGENITVHVIFKQPKPSATVDQTPTYPADAAEFDLPDGDYTLHIRTMAFEHETADIALRD